MLFGNAYNPAFNAPYCSYYGFSCVFFAILLSFLYSLFLWRVFTSYAGSRLTFTFICLLSAFLYQPIPYFYYNTYLGSPLKGAEHREATTFTHIEIKL